MRLVVPSREQQILALRREGYSLAAIGRRFGVSRQRVDQIVRAAGGVEVAGELSRARRAGAVRARRALHVRLARERSGEILERYRGGVDPQAIATELGLQHKVVRGLIAGVRTESDRAARATAQQRAGRPRFSDGELGEGLWLVAGRVGRAPTCGEYERLARELGLASLATVCMRFGGWNRALRAAGLETRTAPVRRGRWSVAACWRALESVSDQLGDPPRIGRYAELAAVRDDLPSAATVRQRLGLWSEIAAVLVEQQARERRAGPAAVDTSQLGRAARPITHQLSRTG